MTQGKYLFVQLIVFSVRACVCVCVGVRFGVLVRAVRVQRACTRARMHAGPGAESASLQNMGCFDLHLYLV